MNFCAHHRFVFSVIDLLLEYDIDGLDIGINRFNLQLNVPMNRNYETSTKLTFNL